MLFARAASARCVVCTPQRGFSTLRGLYAAIEVSARCVVCTLRMRLQHDAWSVLCLGGFSTMRALYAAARLQHDAWSLRCLCVSSLCVDVYLFHLKSLFNRRSPGCGRRVLYFAHCFLDSRGGVLRSLSAVGIAMLHGSVLYPVVARTWVHLSYAPHMRAYAICGLYMCRTYASICHHICEHLL